MAAKFFTNNKENTLYEKFVGVFGNMQNIEYFKAVIGYLRASGYLPIQQHFQEGLQVRIIAGINVDQRIANAQKKGLRLATNNADTKNAFFGGIHEDIATAEYSQNIEAGVLQLHDDISTGRVQIRAHPSKHLHSKFYIFLSPNFNEHNPNGLVIMGSSNLSAQGLGIEDVAHNYEMNVELRDYEDTKFANDEFEKLWAESTPILPTDAPQLKKNTYLDIAPTPFELYVKFLIEYFGNNINYDPDSVADMPNSKYKKLSYQVDAVNQGYDLLMRYNGFFLADVVGTGKTVIAALLAKKFVTMNGTQTKILVVYPPALEVNWKTTFRDFGIYDQCDFITNGSLNKIVDGSHDYERRERYDLILVDEAHKFRNHKSGQFENLQLICKAARKNQGGVQGHAKKVVLISATPLNNKPEDLLYLISLFQDTRNSTLNETNLQQFFSPHFARYKELIKETPLNSEAIQAIFNDIRDRVIKDITIRRTRTDLNKNERYAADLRANNITFPVVAPPRASRYILPNDLAALFNDTADSIIDGEKINFFRYQAIAYLTDAAKGTDYPNADTSARSLAFIMQTQLIKRLESSFHAFKLSLEKITKSTEHMIAMYDRNSIFIAPDLDITQLINEGLSDTEIEEKILEVVDGGKARNRTFLKTDFQEGYIEGLRKDYEALQSLCQRWGNIDDNDDDPKWQAFLESLATVYFNPEENKAQKLVVFTESADTLKYLTERLEAETTYRVLSITSKNRKEKFEEICANFDANYKGGEKKHFKDQYDIILTTDVLAEGINLHRANVIVNYDTPWNPIRLIQRLGRINRIGSDPNSIIYNYNFYPSEQGDKRINLHLKSLAKLQSSHSAFGEDNQIYSLDEIINQFDMFVEKEEGDLDRRIEALEWLRTFKADRPDDFDRIAALPLKARCLRTHPHTDTHTTHHPAPPFSIAFLHNGNHKSIYLYSGNTAKVIPFETAVDLFCATETEVALPPPVPEVHYTQIRRLTTAYNDALTNTNTLATLAPDMDSRTRHVTKLLNDWQRILLDAEEHSAAVAAQQLRPLVENGTYASLSDHLYKHRKETKLTAIVKLLLTLAQRHVTTPIDTSANTDTLAIPRIIISETFV